MTDRQTQRWSRVTVRMGALLAVASLAGLLVDASPAWGQGVSAATFLVVDEQARAVHGYDSAGAPVGSFALDPANSRPSSVAGNAATVYVLDRGRKRIYRYSGTGSLETVSAELRRADAGSLSTPGGLAIDGDQLWLVDRGRARALRYSLAEAFAGGARLAAVAEIPLLGENARAEGLAVEGPFLYVLDETDKLVYRYGRYVDGWVEASGIMRQPGGGSLGAPSGVTVQGGALFVSDRSRDRLFEYDLEDLFSGQPTVWATRDFPLAAANADARGLHHVGEADYLSVCEAESALAPAGVEEVQTRAAAAPRAAPPLPAPCDAGQRKLILDGHNDVRTSRNQDPKPPTGLPKPKPDLGKLTWSNNLGDDARKHAAKCTTQHGGEGENISWSFGTPGAEKTINDAIQGWNGERGNYTGQTTYPGNYGHYTQMIWRETTEIGCAINQCAELTGQDGKTVLKGTLTMYMTDSSGKTTVTTKEIKEASILVCRYAKAGNKQTFHPYDGNRP